MCITHRGVGSSDVSDESGQAVDEHIDEHMLTFIHIKEWTVEDSGCSSLILRQYCKK